MSEINIKLSKESVSDFHNLAENVFAPLKGFMCSNDYEHTVHEMRLASGEIWTIPITLEIPENQIQDIVKEQEINIQDDNNQPIGKLFVEDIYKIDPHKDVKLIFGTDSTEHPGVFNELKRSPYRVGGRIEATAKRNTIPGYMTPAETKNYFTAKGWKSVTGFQTRNPIHMAHEYQQRSALNLTDALFIQPIVGWKKSGDFTHEAVMAAYNYMIKNIYPEQRVLLAMLETPMRYAGPREAVFHAIIRRNFGCSHFIVGRDHAGVKSFYGTYAAHELVNSLDNIGINILTLFEPYFCKKCGFIVNEKSCAHYSTHYEPISGTAIRSAIKSQESIPEKHIRSEILKLLIELNIHNKCFIQ